MDNQNLGGQIPPQTQPPIKPPLNKGMIIGLSVAIIVLLVAVIYLLTAKKAVSPEVVGNNQANQNQQVKNEDATAGWKTYTYGKVGYDFEFKYPADWKAPQSSPYGVVVLGCPEVNLEGDLQCPIFIEVRPPLSKNEYIKTMTPMKFEYQNKLVSNMDFVETQIDGFNSISYLDAGLDILAKAVIFGENGIIIFNDSGANYYQSGIFNQIISTFKFTNQNETADWKTYKNEKYGFEFKYPTDFEVREAKVYNRIILSPVSEDEIPFIQLIFNAEPTENVVKNTIARLSKQSGFINRTRIVGGVMGTEIGYEDYREIVLAVKDKTLVITSVDWELNLLDIFLSTFKFTN